MRTAHARATAAIAAVAAGVIAGYELKPSQGGRLSANAASAQPPAEVRTQVIHRTIHVVRHERLPGQGRRGGLRRTTAVAHYARTGASGSHLASATTGAAGVSTRTSGANIGSGAAGAVPVRTHASGAASAPGTSRGGTVRTHTSGAAAGGGTVKTRTSGSRSDDGGGND